MGDLLADLVQFVEHVGMLVRVGRWASLARGRLEALEDGGEGGFGSDVVYAVRSLRGGDGGAEGIGELPVTVG